MVHRTRGAAIAALVAGALALSACGGGGDNGAEQTDAPGGEPQAGGTLYWLQSGEQFERTDPQRTYVGENLAFFTGYVYRPLTSFTYSEDINEASEIVGDLATDAGTPNDDATEWQFTIRDGVMWEDGSEVTCEDVKYGVSRTFATDIITDGPTYAIDFLDVPAAEDGEGSAYKGPFTGEGQELFDQAVTCDGSTITFKLNQPVGDFNGATTLAAFSPVKASADTGEKYDEKPMSNGPYRIEEYTKGQQLVLVRNEQWNAESDPLRPAYPDRVVSVFNIEDSVQDQRLIADAGNDQYAVHTGIESENLATVFNDERFAERRWDELDPYVNYYAINTVKVPNVKHRQAILAAMNRATIIAANGGDFAGEDADGLVKPNIGQDYAETELWTVLLGQEIPAEGDPEFAKQLVEESGEPMPELTLTYREDDTEAKVAAAFIEGLARADIVVKPNGLEESTYYSEILGKPAEDVSELNFFGWAPDWLNASSVLPVLVGEGSFFDLSFYADEDFQSGLTEALATTDREAQATQWQELNKQVAEDAIVAPWLFGRDQRLAGSKVQGAYLWGPYGSWPYAQLWVEQ